VLPPQRFPYPRHFPDGAGMATERKKRTKDETLLSKIVTY